MNPALPLLAPIALLLPGAAGMELAHQAEPAATLPGLPPLVDRVGPRTQPPGSIEPVVPQGAMPIVDVAHPEPVQQVSIEQRLTVRISPRSAAPVAMLVLPDTSSGQRWTEKKMGKCLPIGGIAAVQYRDQQRLILYLRDRRIVSATLEKACRAADFYSGFYVAKNGDGMLCAGRDEILSRSGANCQLSGIRQMVEAGD